MEELLNEIERALKAELRYLSFATSLTLQTSALLHVRRTIEAPVSATSVGVKHGLTDLKRTYHRLIYGRCVALYSIKGR